MQLLLGLGTLAVEYSLRYLVLLYMVPLAILMMGARATTDGACLLVRRRAAFNSRADQLRQVAAQLRKGVVLILLAAAAFLAVFYRAEILQCLANLF